MNAHAKKKKTTKKNRSTVVCASVIIDYKYVVVNGECGMNETVENPFKCDSFSEANRKILHGRRSVVWYVCVFSKVKQVILRT